MRAGYAKVNITPPVGTRMYGFGRRDRDQPCVAVHDDLFTRALYLEHEGQEVLIVGFDLLFFSRAQADAVKGAMGARLDLSPRQILLNTTHTHAGPMHGLGTWTYADYLPPERVYQLALDKALVVAATSAQADAREVTMWAGAGQSTLPISRRKLDENGIAQWAPDFDAPICDALPLVLFKDKEDRPVGLLFSISCHPSCVGGQEISADYPGVAVELIDRHLGASCAIFLQGCAGEAKSRYNAKDDRFEGSFDAVEKGGRHVAQEVTTILDQSLTPIEPDIRTNIIDMAFNLQPIPSRAEYEAFINDEHDCKRMWAKRWLERMDRGMAIEPTWPMYMHGVQLGKTLRMVALEAEAVAAHGHLIFEHFDRGITFPLAYSNGTQAYLPTTKMLDEHGYEVDSYWEYGLPAPFAPGIENVLNESLCNLLQ